MLTPEQRAKLDAFANGQVVCDTKPQVQLIQVQASKAGCEESCNVAATQETRAIDVANANQAQCGVLPLYIDTTNSTISGSRQLVLGGCISGGDVTIATEYFGFPTTALLADLDVANVIGGKSANYNPTLFIPWLQCQIENNNMTFNGFTVENLGGAGGLTAFNTFKSQRIATATLEPWSSWGKCESGRNRIVCGPCTDNENIAQFTGFIGVSARAASSMIIPEDLNVVLEFCVYNYEGARNITVC